MPFKWVEFTACKQEMAHRSVLFAKIRKTCDWNGIFFSDSIYRATIRKSWSAGTIWSADDFLFASETLVRNWKLAGAGK